MHKNTPANAGKIYFVSNENSAFYASDMDDVSISKERFVVLRSHDKLMVPLIVGSIKPFHTISES